MENKKRISLRVDNELIRMLEKVRAGRTISHADLLRRGFVANYNLLFNQNKPTE